MHIPKQIKIGAHWYVIKYPYQFDERGDISGQHDASNRTIKIDNKDSWNHKEKPESNIAVTLLHEIMHACDNITGHEIFSTQEGEKALQGISEILLQVIRDNNLNFIDQ